MRTTVERLSSNQVKINFVVDAQTFEQGIVKAYNKIKGQHPRLPQGACAAKNHRKPLRFRGVLRRRLRRRVQGSISPGRAGTRPESGGSALLGCAEYRRRRRSHLQRHSIRKPRGAAGPVQGHSRPETARGYYRRRRHCRPGAGRGAGIRLWISPIVP